MKIERTITLTKKDLQTLCDAAYILEHLTSSRDARCWTSRDIYNVCNKTYEFSEFDGKIIYEGGDE